MCYIGSDVHQVRNTLTALPFGITFKEFANLEEQHDKDCLGKLGFCTRYKTNTECSDSGNRHQKMFVEGLAMGYSFCGFFERVVTDDEIGHEIDEQKLPGRKCETLLNNNGNY